MSPQTPPQNPDTLGQRIRQARARAGLYQRELAKTVGISTHYLCRVERDHLKPSDVLVGKIARACAVPVDELTVSAA